jgi:hypothetical protein
MINHITLNDLRRMTDREGLILQGCGGDPQEWLDGINDTLTEAGILLDGDKWGDVSVFEHGGHSNLLFDMDGVKLDVGKLAMWRLQTHSNFSGTWASDYVPNRLGGFVDGQSREQELPDAPIVGADGNIFNILGIAARTLKDHGLRDQAAEMRERVTASCSYDAALGIIMEYVNPVSVDEEPDEDEDYDEDYDEPDGCDEDESEDQGFGMGGLT